MSTGTVTWLVATRRNAKARATIADVARVAGVNKGTASRALRGISGVGAGTRQRILQAADQLEFSASHLAMALATGQSKTVGVIVPTLGSWYFIDVAAGASEILIPRGFRVELINLDIDSDFMEVDSLQFRMLFDELGAGRGRDALLFAGAYALSGPEESNGDGSPLTTVPGIVIDQQQGGRAAGAHLAGLGHHDIAVLDGRILGKDRTFVWDQRTDGLLDSLAANGVDPSGVAVFYGGDCHGPQGERAMERVLERGTIPTAVFCHTDEMAFGAMAVLRRAGLRCPEDVTVVGFDDHPQSAFWGLTTVSQHAHEQGVRAARALIGAVENAPTDEPDRPPALTADLVVRETSGPPRTLV